MSSKGGHYRDLIYEKHTLIHWGFFLLIKFSHPVVSYLSTDAMISQALIHFISKDDLELLTPLPPPPKCWDFRPVPPHRVYAPLGVGSRGLRMLSKHSSNSALIFITSVPCGASHMNMHPQNKTLFLRKINK